MGSLGVKKTRRRISHAWAPLSDREDLASEGDLRSDTFSKKNFAANFFYLLILISGL
jgi:hypothetical protein